MSGDPYNRLIWTLWAIAIVVVTVHWLTANEGPRQALQAAGLWIEMIGLLAILARIGLTVERWGGGAGPLVRPLKVFGFEIGAEPEPLQLDDSYHSTRIGRASLKFDLPTENLQALSRETEEALNLLREETRMAEKEAAQKRGQMKKRLTERIDKVRSSVGQARSEIREAQVGGVKLEWNAVILFAAGLLLQVIF